MESRKHPASPSFEKDSSSTSSFLAPPQTPGKEYSSDSRSESNSPLINGEMESRKQPASPSFEKDSPPSQTPSTDYNSDFSSESTSPLIDVGDPPQTTADEHSNLCSSTASGLHTQNLGHSEFRGLGSLDLSSLPAQLSMGQFQEWWQSVKTNTEGSAAFFQPFLVLPPLYLSTFESLYPADLQPHPSGVNGRGTSPPTTTSAMHSSSLTAKTIPKPKKRFKPMKSSSEIPSTSGCLSASRSESASDEEETSTDPDDVEDDDDDPNSDDSDPEKQSPVKKKIKRLTHTSESKKKRSADGNTTQESLCHSVPVISFFQPQPLPHQPTALSFQRAMATQEEGQQHISVIQPTGLAASSIPLTQSHGQACPSSYKSSPNSSTNMSTLTSQKHLNFMSLPNQSPSYLQPVAFCSPKNPSSLCSLPKQPPHGSCKPFSCSSTSHMHSPSIESSHELTHLMTPKKHTRLVKNMKESCRSFPDEHVLQPNSFELKDSVKQASSIRLKNQSDTDLLLNIRLNRATHSAVQDAPLALVTEHRSQSCSPNSKSHFASARPSSLMPVNLSTGTKKMSNSSASSGLVPGSGKTTVDLHELTKPNSHYPHIEVTRNNESEFSSSNGSDESFEDDGDESEDDDSGSSLSDSQSSLESDDSEDHIKDRVETEAACDAEKTLLKPPEASASTFKASPLNRSSDCSLLNQRITKPLVFSCESLLNPIINSEPLNKPDTLSSSVTFKTTPGKRRSVIDEKALQLPLKSGWQRETRFRTVAGRPQAQVTYFAPCGRSLRQLSYIIKYLVRNGITEISRENFSFSTKVKVGNFYEVREGAEGLQWVLLTEDEVASRIITMDGRRSQSKRSEHQSTPKGPGVRYPHPVGEDNLQDVTDAKLMRKLKAQEIARQAAQIKLMKKEEKRAIAEAAKEAKKQQAMLVAEERRKKREAIKIFKEQEKIKRIQLIRKEKELRAQQVLEEKRKKKEAAANAKLLEAEKRTKEKEIRRLQAVILKQELERHRLEMEKEHHRTRMRLMKAVEARIKAEEKERLKQEKKDKIRLNKEKKLALRRMELEKAKALRQPKEDMCLTDHKPLPELSSMPGLVLPGKTISDCLMVLQFLHNFGKVLRLDLNSDMLTISNFQEGLLNIGKSMHIVQDVLVSMLSAAVCDPGIPAGRKCKTVFGDHLSNVKINRDNVSEILQIYMESHPEETKLASLAVSLKTKAFQAHRPSQKAAVLAFLVNELCCSKAVISEIDTKIEHMTSLRKDKWIVEGKLRKLRDIHASTAEKRDSYAGNKINHTIRCSMIRNKCNRKEGDSEEEEEYENDSEDQGQENDYEEEEEEPGGKKMKKTEIYEEEDEGAHSNSVEELEKQIEEMYQLLNQIRQELFDSSHSLRSTIIGEDRYKRRYWVLPKCGGIFVEGHEGVDRKMSLQGVGVEEEQQEQEGRKPEVFIPEQESDCDNIKPQCPQNKDSIYPQELDSLSKLSEMLEVSKMIQDLDINSQIIPSIEVPTSDSDSSYLYSQTDKINTLKSSELGAYQFKNCNGTTYSPQSILHYNGLSKILTEKCSEWFSLLPRSPCDESSLTFKVTSPASSSSSSSKPIWIKPSSFVFPGPRASANHSTTAGVIGRLSPVPHQVKAGIHQNRQTPLSSATSSSLPLSGTSLPPMLDLSSQQAEANGNRNLCLAQNSSVNNSKTVEIATTQDSPQPIPEEMLCGWWRVSNMEDLQSLLKTLHCRGIRERVLQKQIQKQMEHLRLLFSNNNEELDATEPELCELRKERVESWCVEEQAMKVDVNLLQQVESLEKKIISANLQVKGWMPHESQSNSEHLVYYEHKHFASSAFQNQDLGDTNQKEPSVSLTRRSNNPLDIAVTRFAELERNIEQSKHVTPGIKLWRKALSQVCSSAQLWLCIQWLQKTTTWKQAMLKRHCQLCQKRDNKELLLLCNVCDKGCHTYCHNPKITKVPEGDWFCSFCVAKENGQLPHSKKQQSRTAGGGKRCVEENLNGNLSAAGGRISEEVASSNNVPKKSTKESKKRKADVGSDTKCEGSVSCPKKAKTSKTNKDRSSELSVCRVLLAKLEAHQDAWPFLTPVNLKAVPGYKKVIKKPMDFSTIKEKLNNKVYLNLEGFINDVNLVFDNCEKFNEDDSEIGRAGHSMRTVFDKRWTKLLQKK